MTTFKPQLAVEADLDKLRFPLHASAKLDGVRAIVINGVVMSRSLKPIPNAQVQRQFCHLEGYDGELIVGEPTSKSAYRDTVSHVMSRDKISNDTRYYVFDHIAHPTKSYLARLQYIDSLGCMNGGSVIRLNQHYIATMANLLQLETKLLDEGYEGLILRDPTAPYKYGRSTVNEGFLLKLKRFTDAEFEIVGFEERMHNGNEATTNELGRTKRSSHQENLVGRGDLGALVLQGDGIVFNVGTGFDDAQRRAIWDNRDDYIGQLAKIKYFSIGVKDAPRFPVYLGVRDRSDT